MWAACVNIPKTQTSKKMVNTEMNERALVIERESFLYYKKMLYNKKILGKISAFL